MDSIEELPKKPNCYKCKHRRDLMGNAHSLCVQIRARVEGHPHGINNGWFGWPINFDPTWLLKCDSYEEIK